MRATTYDVSPRPFASTFIAGFECSTQRRYDGLRIDMVEASRHLELCDQDYALAAAHGMKTVRDGFRWHLIEAEPGRYDWSSVRPMLEAARRQNVQVVWDLCHYGYPDWLDIWSDAFIAHLAAFSRAAVELIVDVTGSPAVVCPVNEISFWAWLGGTEGKIAPHTLERGDELKVQLVRASLAAISAIREVAPHTIVVSAEPLINIVRDTNDEIDIAAAAAYHEVQYEAIDMMLGRMRPELGGHDAALDLIGVNYYPHNQWRIRGGFVPLGHHDYRPLSELLGEIHARYRKPLFIAETGAEHSARSVWLSYVCQEVRAATAQGVPVDGICLYPIAAHPGWDNDRICQVGLFSHAPTGATRTVDPGLARELDVQRRMFDSGDRRPEADRNVRRLTLRA